MIQVLIKMILCLSHTTKKLIQSSEILEWFTYPEITKNLERLIHQN